MKKSGFVILLWFSCLWFSCRSSDHNTPDPVPEVLLDIKFPLTSKYTVPDDNLMKKEAIELGKMLFYDNRLSADNTISCASCHQQAKAFTDGQAFSTGINGHNTKRSAMSLTNLLWIGELFWDGRANSLEDQVHFPMADSTEMNQAIEIAAKKLQNIDIYPSKFKAAFGSDTITPDRIQKAIAQFERTLISVNSRYDQYRRSEINLTDQEMRGLSLWQHPYPEQNIRGGNCNDCHSLAFTTDNLFRNNGLDAEPTDRGRENVTGQSYDRGKMRVPTLRNIALTAPYMHDGRFKTLDEVLDHYNEHIQNSTYLDPLISAASNEVGGKTLALTAQEKLDIIVFLKTLTDTTFVQNKSFSNPFAQ